MRKSVHGAQIGIRGVAEFFREAMGYVESIIPSLHAGNLPEGMQVVNLLLAGTLLPEGV